MIPENINDAMRTIKRYCKSFENCSDCSLYDTYCIITGHSSPENWKISSKYEWHSGKDLPDDNRDVLVYYKTKKESTHWYHTIAEYETGRWWTRTGADITSCYLKWTELPDEEEI